MSDFKIFDFIKFYCNGQEYFGRVVRVSAQKLSVLEKNSLDNYTVDKKDAEVIRPVCLDSETFRKFARYEIGLSDLVDNNAYEVLSFEGSYDVSLEDLLCVLKKVVRNDIDDEVFLNDWYCFFEPVLFDLSYDESEFFYNRNTVLSHVTESLSSFFNFGLDTDIPELITVIENFLEDENKPALMRRYPHFAKTLLLTDLNDDSALNIASEDEAVLYKRFAEELCEKGADEGLIAVGYGCYGGNRVFPCDWKKSEECMLRLIDTVDGMPDRAFYANTLGYIYYYGRTTDGKPDYEKAYKYFSLAAFNGIYEAEYKVADMFKNGCFVPKSIETAKHILSRLYKENLQYVKQGKFNCKFADIAYRMGNIQTCEYRDYNLMLKYYCQASFAIRMRMIETDYYGDKTVADEIEKSLCETKESIKLEVKKKIRKKSLSDLFSDCLDGTSSLSVTAKKLKNGNFKLTFSPSDEKRMFLTVPELDMCGLYDRFSVTVIPDKSTEIYCPDEYFYIDEIVGCDFFFEDELVFSADYGTFEFSKPASDLTKHRFVCVKFSDEDNRRDYLCDNENIKIGDRITVNSNGKEAEVIVVNVFEKSKSETSLPFNFYKKL